MPELKRLFLKGRMNKDLDERLVPNGEYRDALNIQIGSSEGSDVGAIENILGNQVARKKRTKQEWALEDGTHNYYGLPFDATCIGAIKDDITDKIYYFVTSSESDCIIEYDKARDAISPILVDTLGILKFSTNNLITGVNIIGDYLFFTDDNSEPKKISLKYGTYANNSSNFTTHSQYKGRNFTEADITVIKKSPLNAPKISLSNSKRGGNVITTLNYNFAALQTESGALVAALLPYNNGGVSQTFTFNTSVDFQEGDLILLETDALGTDPDYESYIVRAEVETVLAANSVEVKITNISPFVPDDSDTLWQVELQQDEAPFEKKMPRIGYRWKYEDNQYSTFSPFTEVAFLGTEFDYNSAEGYNKGMINEARLITVFNPSDYSNFTTEVLNLIPDDVKEIEILYKETNNPTIYVVDDIKIDDFSAADWAGYKIDSDIIFKVVQSNQLLRPWDNVPRKAKAQELVGNRIVYGNYLQNYTLNTTPIIEASAQIDENTTIIINEPSVKSNRNYQVGVVFKDEYGRETPVFTSQRGGIRLNKRSSVNKNVIKASGIGAAPAGFTHYKFFIKDTAGQYYNLAVDSAYVSKDDVSLWIAFQSSERNKVQEGDFISLKKYHDSNTAVTASDNKYKILDISNEAPNELKLKRELEISQLIQFGDTFGSITPSTSLTVKGTPVEDESVFCIAKTLTSPTATDGVSNELKKSLKQGAYIRFENDLGISGYYKIADVYYNEELTAPQDDAAKVKITGRFGSDVNFLYKNDGTLDLIQPGNTTIHVYGSALDENDENFDGVFFAKIRKNQLIIDALWPTGQNKILNVRTFPAWENLALPDANLQITDTDYDAPYDPTDQGHNKLISVWGGGVVPKRDNTVPHYNGGLGFADSGNSFWNQFSTDPGNVGAAGEIIDNKWDIVFEYWLRNAIQFNDNDIYDEAPGVPREYFEAMQVGTKIQFANHSTVYTIEERSETTISALLPGQPNQGQNDDLLDFSTKVFLKFTTPLEQTVNPNFLTGTYPDGLPIRIIGLDKSIAKKTNNPAIFETDPQEFADLNIYYEASDAFPIADYNNVKTLTWHNCFTFGNGVESDRIQDDFNAPFIDKGTKASAVLEESYQEERRATGLIYSGLYNSTSGLNDLNQFIQAEKITKDLNPVYGSIQKLHTRDTNLVALCEDKILRILANKDALFNADGNANLTSTNNVLGQAVPFAGEFGISKNPESFASYGFRAYFTDKKRGVVLRLSMDGLTEISAKGMTDYFWENLKAANTVLGSYDIYSDSYNLTLNNQTVSFKESMDGWPTRKSFIPEWGISLNSDYYTMYQGMLWSHDSENRNTFYEGPTAKSSVQLIFNDSPNKIKNFKTLSYEGDNGWTAPLIQTDQQDGSVETFLDKENIYYNYIKGEADSWGNSTQSGTLDLKQFAAQGIGNPTIVRNANNDGPYTGHSTFTVTVKNDPNS